MIQASLTEFYIAILGIIGFPLLLVIMFLRGVFIGKLLPATVVLPGYIVFSGINSLFDVVILALLTSFSLTVGQLVIYHKFDKDEGERTIKLNKFVEKIYVKIYNISKKRPHVSMFLSNLFGPTRGLPLFWVINEKRITKQEYVILTYLPTFLSHSIIGYITIFGIEILF